MWLARTEMMLSKQTPHDVTSTRQCQCSGTNHIVVWQRTCCTYNTYRPWVGPKEVLFKEKKKKKSKLSLTPCFQKKCSGEFFHWRCQWVIPLWLSSQQQQCSAAHWDVLQLQQFLFWSFLTSDVVHCFWKQGLFSLPVSFWQELFHFICVSYMFTLYLTLPKRKTILNVLSLLFSKASVSFVLRWGRSRDRLPLCGYLPYCLWQSHYRWRHLSLFPLLFKSD